MINADKVAREIADTYKSWHINFSEHKWAELYQLVYDIVRENDDSE